MSRPTYTCDACGGTFEHGWSEEEAVAKAQPTFTEGELSDVVIVCDDCLRDMRAAMPDLDERYAEPA